MKLIWVILIISLVFFPALAEEKASVVVKVTDEKSGLGIPGVRILLSPIDIFYTDSEGIFRIKRMNPGYYGLMFYPPPPYCSLSQLNVEIEEGENIVNHTLGIGGSIKGRILISPGRPLENALVRVKNDVMQTKVAANNDGTFFIDNLCAGAYYNILITHKTLGIAFYYKKDITIEEGAGTILDDIIFDNFPDTKIEGIVISEIDGEPIANMKIELSYQSGCDHCGEIPFGIASTDSRGFFEIKNIQYPGKFFINAFLPYECYPINPKTGKKVYIIGDPSWHEKKIDFYVTKGITTKVLISSDTPLLFIRVNEGKR